MSKPFDPNIDVNELHGKLDGYLFIKVIGDGGQATVYKAIIINSGVEVAVKLYSPNQLLKRAELEVEKLERVTSPYLANLIDYGNFELRGQSVFYVVSEYVEGHDLKKTLTNRVLDQSQSIVLLSQMLHAIDELWKLRIVHCDIKPANIMCAINGNFQLIDLGIAKHLDNQTITMAGMIMGTFGYMSPEQLSGRKNLTLRVDLFALGIVLYEAITGFHPFNKNQHLIGRITPEPINDYVEVDTKLVKAINMMLEPNPIRRPASCQQIFKIVEGVN